MANYQWLIVNVGCYILLVLSLILVIIEDFKYRAVRWWAFPLLGLTAIGIEYKNLNYTDILINSCFILTQLILLSLYFSIKEKKAVNITNRYLGWGDILLWLVSCLLFAPLNFMLFFMGSLLFTSIIVLSWKALKIKSKMDTVPLAGMQALALLILLPITFLIDNFSFRESIWIEKLLMA